MFPGIDDAFINGRPFPEIVAHVVERGYYGYSGKELETFITHRIAAHNAADGAPTLQLMADGSWLINRESRLKDGGIVGIRTDVTELKRRETELEKLKSRYELILGAAGDGIVGLDDKGRVRFVNPAAAAMLKTEAAGLNKRPVAAAMGADGLPAFPLAGTQAREGELVCTRADGKSYNFV